jgi:hypothetical protein
LLPEPVYLLLAPDQLVLLSLGFIFLFFVPLLDFDLVELSFALIDLWRQRWWRRFGIEVLITSASLDRANTSVVVAGAYCGGGHVGLL